MRFYLTEQIGSSLVVVAEVIGRVDPHTGEQVPHSMAELDSPTREQLLEVPGGRRALWAWERGDDSTYAAGREAFMREGDIEEVRELASSGNRWAQELADADFPDDEVRAFLASDRAVPVGLHVIA